MEITELLLFILAVILLAQWCALRIVHLLAVARGINLHRKTRTSLSASLPGVSILKPIKGTDPNIMDNLESFFTSTYPKFELLFCVQHENDPSIPVVRRLLEKYPSIDARLFIGQRNVGVNPKINNMISGYETAKYDLLLISDAGVKMKEDTVLLMVETMTDEVGLVHQMPYRADRPAFVANLEKVYFGTLHAMCYLCCDVLGINCATGMSCLYRKQIIEDAGGLQAFSHYLAEDFYLSRMIIEKGYKCRVCPYPAQQNPGVISVTGFNERMARWTKLRFSVMPYMRVVEPCTLCLTQGVLFCWTVYYLFAWNPLTSFIGHILVWILLDYYLLFLVQGGPLPFSTWEYVGLWFFREMCSVYWMVKSKTDPLVKWRENEFILLPNSMAKLRDVC